MKKALLLLGLVVVGAVVVGGYVVARQAADELGCSAEDYRDLVEPLLREWADAEELAGQTPRSALRGSISEMQAVRRDINNLDIPACAVVAHMELTFYCDRVIDAYLAFMAQLSDDDITDDDIGKLFRQASDHFEDWERLVSDLD